MVDVDVIDVDGEFLDGDVEEMLNLGEKQIKGMATEILHSQLFTEMEHIKENTHRKFTT